MDVLGLRVSDTSGDVIAFLHSPHGSDHHLIALAKSGGLGLHHTSWCVASLDDVGLGMEQMSAAGHGEGWGVGRHVLGSNYFRYVRAQLRRVFLRSYPPDALYVPTSSGFPTPTGNEAGLRRASVWRARRP